MLGISEYDPSAGDTRQSNSLLACRSYFKFLRRIQAWHHYKMRIYFFYWASYLFSFHNSESHKPSRDAKTICVRFSVFEKSNRSKTFAKAKFIEVRESVQRVMEMFLKVPLWVANIHESTYFTSNGVKKSSQRCRNLKKMLLFPLLHIVRSYQSDSPTIVDPIRNWQIWYDLRYMLGKVIFLCFEGFESYGCHWFQCKCAITT